MPPVITKPIIDERQNLQGQPGLHVLIAGVSGYLNLPEPIDPDTPYNFGMRPLSSTSLTAFEIYQWLIAHKDRFPVPLATCRLLLSPSATELAIESRLQEAPACTLNNFLRAAKYWRIDACSHPGNVTLFYFAGHGIERNKGDSVLLLEEFGDGIGGALRNAVDMYNIFYGMTSTPPLEDLPQTQQFAYVAQKQLYFVDACRNLPRAIPNFAQLNTTPVFNVELAGADKRAAPIYYAAAPGTPAQAVPSDQTLFSKALIDCLNGDAGIIENVNGQDRWHVSVHSLVAALKVKIDDLNAKYGAQQYFVPDGQVINDVICFLDGPPSVEVVLEVDPPDALQLTRIEVRDEFGALLAGVPVPLDPHPYHMKCPAGFYAIGATIEPPDVRFMNLPGRIGLIKPPRIERKVRVKS